MFWRRLKRAAPNAEWLNELSEQDFTRVNRVQKLLFRSHGTPQ